MNLWKCEGSNIHTNPAKNTELSREKMWQNWANFIYISKNRLTSTLKSRFSCKRRPSFWCYCDCWCLSDFGHSHVHFTQFWVWVHHPMFMLVSKTNFKAAISLWPCIPWRPQLSSSSKVVVLKLEYAKNRDIQMLAYG